MPRTTLGTENIAVSKARSPIHIYIMNKLGETVNN